MEIHYRATTDKATVCNLTHHSFFNLNGDGGGEVINHIVTIDAPFYTPMDDKSVPTGEIASVAGTPMDFLHPVALGQRIDDDFEQLRFGRGYDHNYVLAKKFPGEYAFAAEAYSPRTGIVMTVYTTEPGVQLYTCASRPNIFPTAPTNRISLRRFYGPARPIRKHAATSSRCGNNSHIEIL